LVAQSDLIKVPLTDCARGNLNAGHREPQLDCVAVAPLSVDRGKSLVGRDRNRPAVQQQGRFLAPSLRKVKLKRKTCRPVDRNFEAIAVGWRPQH
jgi:hypothetical protein